MDRERAQRVEAKFITAISEAELAVRLCEAHASIRRPPGATAEQSLNGLDEEDRNRWRRAAVAAMNYWRECIASAQQPS